MDNEYLKIKRIFKKKKIEYYFIIQYVDSDGQIKNEKISYMTEESKGKSISEIELLDLQDLLKRKKASVGKIFDFVYSELTNIETKRGIDDIEKKVK